MKTVTFDPEVYKLVRHVCTSATTRIGVVPVIYNDNGVIASEPSLTELIKENKVIEHSGEPVATAFQHNETGNIIYADKFQMANGFELHNPRLHKVYEVFDHPPGVSEAKSEATGWRPIDTAPEDGSSFIGYGKFPQGKEFQVFVAHYASGGYTEGWADDSRHREIYLTHWMPINKPRGAL